MKKTLSLLLPVPLLYMGLAVHDKSLAATNARPLPLITVSSDDSLLVSNAQVTLTVNSRTGKVSYQFYNGVRLQNTIATIDELHAGKLVRNAATRSGIS